MSDAGHNTALSDLRRRVVLLERASRARRGALAFGVEALDGHLPWGGLPLGQLHEVVESGVESEHSAAATLFSAAIAARLKGMVLWCVKGRDLFAPALACVGLGPDRVIYVETRNDAEVLPAMEEALRHGGLAAVVGEVARLGLTASRRLQLAAEGSGVPALVVRRWRNDGERAAANEPTAVFTRWRVAPAPSRALQTRAQPPPLFGEAPAVPGIGRACWQVELLRCRGAEPASWILEAPDGEGRLALPSDVSDRPHSQAGGRGGAPRLGGRAVA